MGFIISGVFLLAAAVMDIRTHMIDSRLLVLFATVTAGMFAILRNVSVPLLVFGCIPGILSLMTAKITKESIGYGDGWMILLTGIAAGPVRCMGILMTALLGVCLSAVLLIVIRRNRMNTEIPFLPFMLFGWIVQALTGY